MNNIPSQITTLLAGITVTLVSLWYGQNHGLLPVAASEEAAQIDGIFDFMMTVATGLFIIIQGALIYCLIKFRRKKGDNTDGPPIEGNIALEITWTAIPAIIIFIVAIYSFEVYNAMGGLDPMASHDMGPQQISQDYGNPHKNLLAVDSSQGEIALGLGASPEYEGKEKPLEVNVNALQFAFIFSYPDSGITTGEMHIPIGREIKLNINAADVIHAFWLPEFRLKQDAIPGRQSQLHFTANRIGDYPVVCAELCGPYHGAMNTRLYVDTPEDFENWITSQTVAQAENKESLAYAVNPQEQTPGEFLTPFVKEMGFESNTVMQLHTLHDHSTMHVNHQ